MNRGDRTQETDEPRMINRISDLGFRTLNRMANVVATYDLYEAGLGVWGSDAIAECSVVGFQPGL
jgi:hypothetical protein